MRAVQKYVLCLLVLLALVAVASAQMPPNLENGFKNWGSYDSTKLDTVNTLNGNQMLHAPLLPNYPQRGGSLTMQSFFYQTSKAWQVSCSVDFNGQVTCQWAMGRQGVNLRQSEGLTIQRTLHQNDSGTGQVFYKAYAYSIEDTSGATHQMFGTGPLDATGESTKFDSIDTSSYHLEMSNPDSYGVMTTATITDRQGNQYVTSSWFGATDTGGPSFCPQLPGNHLPPARTGGGLVEPMIDDAPMGQQDCPQSAYAEQVTDRNGNRISNLAAGPTDTLGRTFAFFNGGTTTTNYGGCATGHTTITATFQSYTTPDGTSHQMKLCYASFPISTAFNVSGIVELTGSAPQLSTVILADGTKWTFDYDNYGEVLSVGLPTGGSITYTWTTIAFPTCNAPDGGASRAVATRTLNDNMGHSSRWTYTWGTVVNHVISNTVTDPLNNDMIHTFTALDGGCSFYETQTQSYQGTGGSRHLLKQVDTTYSHTLYALETVWGGALGDVVPTSIQTTTYPSGKVSLVQKTYAPPTVAGGPISGAVATEKYYDWGAPGPLLKETDTTYEWQINAGYVTANMLDLPFSVVVKDGSGNRVAETDYVYDEPSYLTTPTPAIGTQHFAAPNSVRGNLTTVSRWLNTSNSFISSHTNWYDTGEVYQQIDPLGHTTTHSYDSFYAGAYATQTCSPTTNSVAHCVSGTYDFNTGVLTSLTNENATGQASGNSPGDSAHTTSYAYDYMFRLTSATAPPDPANSGLSAHTNFYFSAPNAFPVNIQRTKSITGSITGSITDSATNFFDGLGRSYQSQHVLPGGTATVDTTLDFAGRPATISNPYFSTSDSTYGTTTTQFDGLDRAYSVTKQDGSVSSVAYNVITGAHDAVSGANTVGDCTDTTDEAGKQRRACTDALGRLVQVSEPNPGASATDASGSVVINGSEQSSTQSGAYGSAHITISGGENSVQVCVRTCHTLYDSGNVSISANGYNKIVPYGQGSTVSTVAAALRDAFHGDTSSPVDASCSDQSCTNPVITFTARVQGAATNYALACSSTANDSTDFTPPSFIPGCPAALGGGRDPITTPDSGSVTITVNGTNYSTTYGGGDTTATIAQRLASAISAGTLANGSASGSTVSITTKAGGTGTNYSLAASYAWNNTSFTNPSFTTSTSGSVLTGGYDAGVVDNQPYVTLYQYDALGNLLRVDQKGTAPNDSTQWRTRTFTYDSLSRLLTANNPESGTITYSYDADGNLLQKTSPAPNQTGSATQTVSYCYDELHRVFGKGYGAQSCPLSTPVVTYAYDSGTNAKGHLTSLTDQAGTANYTYDILGRLTTETRTLTGANNASISKTLSYDYNLDGSLYKLHYPSGNVVTYEPGAAGLTLSAKDTGNAINYVTSATYGPDSALTGFISGYSASFAGITNAFSYNKRLQPLAMSANAPSQTVFSIGYDFHLGNGITGADNGNVFGITNYKDQNRNQTFTYDPLNRLISAQNAGTNCAATVIGGKTEYWGNSYGYDAWGNLLQKSVTKCGAENLIVTADAHNWIHASGTDYQYDAAGNMTFNATPPTQTYTYDQENRLTGAAGYAYTYDADGNRVRKSSGSTGTLYWYMTPGIVGESDLSGNLTDEYVFFDGERVARKSTNGVSYYFSDHLKTASVITDSIGNIKSESDFYPWGGELQFVNNDSNHYKFTGKERDAETQLDYFGARHYSNGLGRWVSADWSPKPIPVPYADFHDPQTLNLYGFVGGNPASKADPDGHFPLLALAGGGTLAEFGGPVLLSNPVGWTVIGVAAVATIGYVAYEHYHGDKAQPKAADKTAPAGAVPGTQTKSDAKPGTLGKPDHQATVKAEADRIGGKPEVKIPTPAGSKDFRRADAVGTNPETGKTEIVQVYRPTPAGNIPKREVDAAKDIEGATGVKPTMVPVRPVPNK